ncbi:kinesin-like protein KIF28P [Bolinopsis microptera]|uniref:kinesin-like protein KIF28P n=1 Tax=Bolinopsis microptera TaxID=2820187 RepID=UPI00307A4A39
MAETIKVAVRVRPFNMREQERGAKLVIDMQGSQTIINHPKGNVEPKKFHFDYSYWSHDGYKEDAEGYMHPDDDRYCDQARVFKDLGEGVLFNAWAGYNCSLFAYGQTGSGKSYSIVGYGANKGVIPVVCQRLFSKIEEKVAAKPQDEYEVNLAMIEIYNEQVRDLLNPASLKLKGGLKIREHPKKGFYVDKLTTHAVGSYENIEMKMDNGTKNRTVAATAMNATSSRAHTIVALTFVQKTKEEGQQAMTKTSVINLVDLAGSERAASTAATGDRLKEGAAINQSLSTLGNVIAALADVAAEGKAPGKSKVIVPFRDSSLTKLLKNALGGNSKTVMMAAVSPADINYDESLSTLKFADRVKRIKTVAEVNESPTEKLIRELREENAKLMHMLGGSGIPDVAMIAEASTEVSEEEKEKMRKEIEDELRAQMMQNHMELEDSEKSASQKLQEMEKAMEEERKKKQSDTEKRHKKPYLWNLNEDPALSGVVCHLIERTKVLIGKGEKCQVRLQGLSIMDEHALIEVDKQLIYITVRENAKVTLNGDPLTTRTELHHNDRILFSAGHVYVVHHPYQFKKANKAGKTFEPVTWDVVQTEIAEKSGFDVDRKGKSPEELLLQEDLISLMPMVNEANAISVELDKKKLFEIVLVAPQARGLSKGRTEVMVKISDLIHNNSWLWDRNKFINRKYKMLEMYQGYVDEDADWDLPQDIDPFYETVASHVLIGQAQIHLKCLTYLIGFEESVIITDYQAQERGYLQVNIVPLKQDETPIEDDDDDYFVEEPNELIGKNMKYKFIIVGAKGLPQKISNDVYCEFKLYLEDSPNETDHINSKNPDWNWSKVFSHSPVTEQLLEYLNEEVLIVKVWGKQRLEDDSKVNKLTTKELKSLNEKEKLTSYMKKMEGAGGGFDMATTVRKIELMHQMVTEIKKVTDDAKKDGKTTVDVAAIDAILTPERMKLNDVSQMIQDEKKNPNSQLCCIS